MLHSRLRILIIDDEECIRDSLALHLSELGHEVLTCDKPEGCPAYFDHPCEEAGACADVLFVDYDMPGVDGLSCLRQLTRHGCHTLPPNRILMTRSTTPELIEKTGKMGCRIVKKPLHLAEIEKLVNRARAFIPEGRRLSPFNSYDNHFCIKKYPPAEPGEEEAAE